MACLHVTLAPFSSSRSPASPTLRCTPVRCATERQALFNRIAAVYDYPGSASDLEANGSVMKAKMGDRVLDVCCGSGDLTFPLSDKVWSKGEVIGLDFSKKQLFIASSRLNLLSKNFSNMEWVEGDALELPFSDGSFDAITMVYGLRNVVDRRKAMQEILRVLKAVSRLSILDFNKSNQFLTASAMEWMIENVVVPVASGYGLSEEYRYLKSSIKEFATGKELEELALEVGFSTARHYEINGEALWAARQCTEINNPFPSCFVTQ